MSARRAASSIDATDVSISGGMRLLSFTYASNVECTERISASSSTFGSLASSMSSASTSRNFSESRNRRTRARCFPSTSTFTVPSGSRSSWMIWPIVPTAKMSSAIGSFVFAFFWAQRRMALSWAIASSRAAIDFCRPTNSGTTMCGKTMMSRRGSSGRLFAFFPSFLPSSLREKIATVG